MYNLIVEVGTAQVRLSRMKFLPTKMAPRKRLNQRTAHRKRLDLLTALPKRRGQSSCLSRILQSSMQSFWSQRKVTSKLPISLVRIHHIWNPSVIILEAVILAREYFMWNLKSNHLNQHSHHLSQLESPPLAPGSRNKAPAPKVEMLTGMQSQVKICLKLQEKVHQHRCICQRAQRWEAPLSSGE